MNGIIGVILPVNAHSANETLEQWQADLEVNRLLSQGKELVEQGKLAEALSAYQHVISLERENPRVFSAIGYLQTVQSNFPAAADAFRKAIADILLEQQDYLMAIVEHRQVISLAPKDAKSYYHLRLALRERKRIEEAIIAFKQALNLYQQQGNTKQVEEVKIILDDLQE